MDPVKRGLAALHPAPLRVPSLAEFLHQYGCGMLVDDDFRLRLVGWSGLTSGRMLGGKSRALGSITFMSL